MDEFLEKLAEDQRRMRKYLRTQGARFKKIGESLAVARERGTRIFVIGEPPLDHLAEIVAVEYLAQLPAMSLPLDERGAAEPGPESSGELDPQGAGAGPPLVARHLARHFRSGDVLMVFAHQGSHPVVKALLGFSKLKGVYAILVGGLDARAGLRKAADTAISLPTRGVKTVCEASFIVARILARVARSTIRTRTGSDDEEKLLKIECGACKEPVFIEERYRGKKGLCPLCRAPLKVPEAASERAFAVAEATSAEPPRGRSSRRKLKKPLKQSVLNVAIPIEPDGEAPDGEAPDDEAVPPVADAADAEDDEEPPARDDDEDLEVTDEPGSDVDVKDEEPASERAARARPSGRAERVRESERMERVRESERLERRRDPSERADRESERAARGKEPAERARDSANRKKSGRRAPSSRVGSNRGTGTGRKASESSPDDEAAIIVAAGEATSGDDNEPPPMGLVSHDGEPGETVIAPEDVAFDELPSTLRSSHVGTSTESADPFALPDAFVADLVMPQGKPSTRGAPPPSDVNPVISGELTPVPRVSSRFTAQDCKLRFASGGYPGEDSGPEHPLESLSAKGLVFWLDPQDEMASTVDKGDELWVSLAVPAFLEPVLGRGTVARIGGNSAGGRSGTRVELDWKDLDPASSRKLARAAESLGAST